MKKNSLKLVVGSIALVLLVLLIVQLIKAPTFMFPSTYLVGLFVIVLLIGSLIIAGIIKVIFKKSSFVIILCSIVSIVSIFSMYKFYSPTLTIIVPKGYTGQVTLVLSNVDKDILNVDNNGIGYITEYTFDKVYTKPIVLETDGTDISNQAVGFSPSTFWAKTVSGTHRDSNYQIGLEIDFKSFEVVSKDKQGQKQYYSIDLSELVDKSKLYKK
ncbi:hypothetical protein ACR78F_14715 [Sphingobacterium spiritivorum]|uniref:hypothetical protein n=1 Tax=Sphingobacterium spiritivorum TaxID=258 RepID=UPI003DA22071